MGSDPVNADGDIARQVVYRASDHRFEVDGEPFPWYITQGGARFAKRDGFYLVTVAVLPVEFGDGRHVLDVTLSGQDRQLLIGDRAFPWAVLAGSLEVTVGEDAIVVVHLTFLADEVDTDTEVAVL